MIKTDDPANRQFYLTVTGKVQEIAKVTPTPLSLSGSPGDTLSGVISVAPAEGYGFSVLSLSQKFGSKIKARLIPPEKGGTVWKIRVDVSSDKADDIYDVITLKTDSPFKPLVQIRVYAIYMDKPVVPKFRIPKKGNT